MERKGDFSNRQLCSLSLTPESKAVTFQAVVSLIAITPQHPGLHWGAADLGLRSLLSYSASFTSSRFKESPFSFAPEMPRGAGARHSPVPPCPQVMRFPLNTLQLEARIKSPTSSFRRALSSSKGPARLHQGQNTLGSSCSLRYPCLPNTRTVGGTPDARKK